MHNNTSALQWLPCVASAYETLASSQTLAPFHLVHEKLLMVHVCAGVGFVI